MWHTYITKNRYAKPHNITAKGSYAIGRVVAAAVEAKAATRAVTGQVKAGDVVLELQRFVVVAAEIRLQRKSAG